GSGKSTISKLMNGLLFPQEGEIFVNGIALTEESIWDIRKEVGMVFQNPDNQFVGATVQDSEESIWDIRKEVGMVFQNPDNQFVGATVQDDVAFGMENRGFE